MVLVSYPSYELVNVHEPLERVCSLITNQTKKKIKITRDYDLSLPEVMADRDQLIQVMLNISVNAVQAMTENKEFFVDHQPERNVTHPYSTFSDQASTVYCNAP